MNDLLSGARIERGGVLVEEQQQEVAHDQCKRGDVSLRIALSTVMVESRT